MQNDLPGDSPDLTDAEVASARRASKPGAPMDPIVTCSCGADALPIDYALRRRRPAMFWRVKYQCAQKHETTVVYRIDGDEHER